MLEKVVVGVDGSDASRAAVQWCAAHLETGTMVIAVCGTNEVACLGVDGLAAARCQQVASIEGALRDHWVQPLRRAGLRCDCRVVYCSQAEALREIALVEHPDALVVGKAGHGALVDAVFGGALRRVIHRPPCPLIVVPTSIEPEPADGVEWFAGTEPVCGRRPASNPTPPDPGRAWSPSRIALVARCGDTLVLDCLVPSATEAVNFPASSVPIGLRVLLPNGLAGEEVEETLRTWADNASILEISCGQRNGFIWVQVQTAENESDVVIQLQQAISSR